MKSLKGTEKARVRAQKGAEGRWAKHRTNKTLDAAVSELADTMQDLRRKLQTVATISGEPYSALIEDASMMWPAF